MGCRKLYHTPEEKALAHRTAAKRHYEQLVILSPFLKSVDKLSGTKFAFVVAHAADTRKMFRLRERKVARLILPKETLPRSAPIQGMPTLNVLPCCVFSDHFCGPVLMRSVSLLARASISIKSLTVECILTLTG